jgi:hypothetical protein
MMIELNDVQTYVIGGVASIVLIGLKLLYARFGEKAIRREWVTVVLFLLSLGLAGWWFTPSLPAFPVMVADPAISTGMVFEWLGKLVPIGTLLVGAATIIYNILFKKVYDKLEAKVRASK